MGETSCARSEPSWPTLHDWVESGEEVLITRRGKAVARLVPAEPGFDRAKAALAAQRIRERAVKVSGGFDWAEWKAYRDEGRP